MPPSVASTLQSMLTVFDSWLQENCIDIDTARQFLQLIRTVAAATTTTTTTKSTPLTLDSSNIQSYQ